MANACVRIAVAAVIGLLLVGCNGEDEGGGQTDASVDTETGVSDQAADAVDISTSDAGDADRDDGAAVADAFDASSDRAVVADAVDTLSERPLDGAGESPAPDATVDAAADATTDVVTDPTTDDTEDDTPIDAAHEWTAPCPSGFPISGFFGPTRQLVIDPGAGLLFWSEGGQGGQQANLASAPVTGRLDAGGSPLLFSNLGNLSALAIDPGGASLFWTDYDGAIGTAPSAGPDAGSARTLVTTSPGPYGIAVHAGEIYWTNWIDGRVLKVPIGGLPDGAAPAVVASGHTNPSSVFVDASGVYFTDSGDGTVRWAPLGGVDAGTAVAIATGQNEPVGITAYGGWVYWVNYGANAAGAGSLGRATTPGGAPDAAAAADLATGLTGPMNLAVDASGVYFVEHGGGRISKVPAGTTGVATVLACTVSPWGIAIDATNVYWTDLWAKVRKIAK